MNTGKREDERKAGYLIPNFPVGNVIDSEVSTSPCFEAEASSVISFQIRRFGRSGKNSKKSSLSCDKERDRG